MLGAAGRPESTNCLPKVRLFGAVPGLGPGSARELAPQDLAFSRLGALQSMAPGVDIPDMAPAPGALTGQTPPTMHAALLFRLSLGRRLRVELTLAPAAGRSPPPEEAATLPLAGHPHFSPTTRLGLLERPDLRPDPAAWLRRLRQALPAWLRNPVDRPAPAARLDTLRLAFMQCLRDVRDPAAPLLKAGIYRARTLRDFWHLRDGLYTLVARVHCQAEAVSRLQPLNRLLRPPGLARRMIGQLGLAPGT